MRTLSAIIFVGMNFLREELTLAMACLFNYKSLIRKFKF